MSDGDLLRTALGRACSVLPAEMLDVPLDHWNESVFRFLLVRHLLALAPGMTCWSEWNRVDLVLPAPSGATLVELKFFAHRPHCDLSGQVVRLKGGPSPKNVRELEHSLATLAACPKKPWARACGGIAAAYLVLAYCDPAERDSRRTYRVHYGDLGSKGRIAAVETVVEDVPIVDGTVFTCKLLSVQLDPAA